MKKVIKNNVFGIIITTIVFSGFYVSFLLGQQAIKGHKKSLSRRKSSKKKIKMVQKNF